jgi:hypothetical protein
MIQARLHSIAWPLVLACFVCTSQAQAGEQGMTFQATLVWGTNDPEPQDASLKPVPPAVARKLGKLPFKWTHYYAVECQEFSVAEGQRKKVRMSKDCEILVKAIDSEKVELALRGEGQPVGKVTQKLCEGQMLVTGGNAENFTAWFVVLRRAEPKP